MIEHIDWSMTIFVDLLTRWSKGHCSSKAVWANVRAFYNSITPSTAHISEPIEDQERPKQQNRKGASRATLDEDGFVRINQKMWVPDDANKLKLRIIIEGHCGSAGHRRKDAVENIVCGDFEWRDIKRDVREFAKECPHCIVSKTGRRLPRPLVTALHRQKPNKVVYMDFLWKGSCDKDGLNYVLVLKDDLSAYSWLLTCAHPDSEAPTNGVAIWMASMGSMI